MAKDSADDLKGVVTAARQHRLEAADIALLREKIAEIRALELESRILRTAQRNLGVADTQLRDLQAHAEHGTINEATFAELPAHFAESSAATAFIPAWLPPLSPSSTTCSKPWAFRLDAISRSSARNVGSVRLMVPGYRMCPDGGSMSPSGTNGTFGAQRALPSFRAIASHIARFT